MLGSGRDTTRDVESQADCAAASASSSPHFCGAFQGGIS